ncbi:hypothetical protein K2173_017914 [Erythroxylum novogranatense]|uniref:HVA22-like protein n=1 Tax=Erythroxylum novogranatense TaxID=1862640 RepID=A0AAV8TMW5_9ROSI|nr:hypothetical protein K2173_017914 [Erythroxylum novogranatense]
MGLFLSRALILILGYVHPAYECFKVVEKNGPEIDQLLFWCHYWILIAMFTICERVGDNLISWLPLYNVAKVAFIVYLWYPKTKGADYVYDSVFRPLMAKYETEIDKHLLDMEAKVGEIATAYWRKAATYGQAKLVELLHHVSSQSASQPDPQKFSSTEIDLKVVTTYYALIHVNSSTSSQSSNHIKLSRIELQFLYLNL